MRHKTYMPTTDNGVLIWTGNFLKGVMGSPQTYGLTALQVADYQQLQSDYVAAYKRVTDPGMRTTPAIVVKNQAKRALVVASQQLAMLVSYVPGVSPEDRSTLGLPVRRDRRKSVPPPATAPLVQVQSVMGRVVKVRLSSQDQAIRLGKPTDARNAAVFTYVGDNAPEDMSAWKLEGNTGKTSIEVQFGNDVPPTVKVWIAAYWLNAKGQGGPAGDPAYAYIHMGYHPRLRKDAWLSRVQSSKCKVQSV